jgi:TP901 family phage tail tape measure protein
MADEKIVTNIVATSDFSGLIADVQRTTAALSKLQQELNLSNKTLAAQAGQIQKAFGETLRSTGQFTTHFVTVGSEVETFGKRLDAGKLKLRDYFQTWQTHTKTSGGLIRDLAKQQVTLQQAIVQPLGKSADGLMKFNVNVANGLDEVKNRTAIARKEMQIYNKVIQDGGVQLINWGKNTQWAGRQLTVGLTVPLAAFGAAAAKAFKEADQELVRLQKVYGGLSATSTQELAKVRKDVSDTAKELAGMYGSSYKDTIGLAADIAATGKQGNELLESTKEATRLSILGEVDRQEAMKATLAIQSAFKQNTMELTESINFLNAVENQTSTSLADLVEAIPKAGPVVKALGGDVQDLALYLTAMREGGVNASEGANALKSALASIINPTKVAKEQFMGFGIDLEGIVNKNAGNLTQTILSIQSALDTLDPLRKSQAIEQLFGKFQFARMNALFENLGKQGSQTLQVLDLMKASSEDLANVAGRELSQITESASGQYKRAIESLKADLAGVGEQFLKIGTFFIKVVNGVVKFANEMPGPIKTLLGLLGGITALAGPLIMLTGVFANFIGYVIKGIGHIRALGRGGEGFKLLTPQILAAEQAGNLIEKTFYSDAKAAQILTAALSNLTNEYTILQQKAMSGSISAQPLISTLQGNVVVEGSSRVADPSSPYIGKPYSRQMLHQNPVAGMTTEEKAAQTIFGVTPGPGPVNQRIGKNPQMYMTGDMERIKGLTEISGVSTGIVAEEAAKWHAMTGALAMQSESEIKMLKKEVAATGAITTELSTSYQALLPKMTEITVGAAEEAKLIVAQLNASKITVDQARAQVIQLNARIEAMMAETTAQIAQGQGRVANVTTVPLTGQPVVDPITGKSNMKEMFHKSKTSALVDKIARSLGVRTSGGGYSIETTKPRRLNSGGYVYTMNDGNIVPGPNVNADVVPAILTPGEFVVNREAAQANLPLLQAINGGAGASGPGMITGGQARTLMNMPGEFLRRINLISGVRRAGSRSGRQVYSEGALNYDQMGSRAGRSSVWQDPVLAAGRPGPDEVSGHIYSNDFYKKYGQSSSGSSPRATREQFSLLTGLNIPRSTSGYAGLYDILPNQFMTIPKSFNTKMVEKIRNGKVIKPTATKSDWFESPRKPEHLLSLMQLLTSQGIPVKGSRGVAQQVLNRINSNISKLPNDAIITERIFGNIVTNSTRAEMRLLAGRGELAQRQEQSRPLLPRGKPASGPLASLPRRNRGGLIGYNRGGMVGGSPVRGYRLGGIVGQQIGAVGGSIGGAMLGQSVAGPIGGMVGSIAGGFLPQLLGMLKSRELMTAAQIFTKTNIAIGGTVAALGLAYGAYKRYNDEVKTQALGFGLTSEAATKAGLKYKDLNLTLQEAIKNNQALAEKNRLVYASLTSAGTPLKLTIEEYRKLKEEVKSTMPELIKLVNQTNSKDVGDLAIRLKTMFMQAGDAADEATKKTFALIAASNKVGLAGSAIGSKDFGSIESLETAAAFSVRSFAQAQATGNSKSSYAALQTAINGINAGIDEIMSKSKTNITYQEATAQQFEKINSLVKNQSTLSTQTLNEVRKQMPELGKVLNSTDSIRSAWQKYQLIIQGTTVDLSALSDAGVNALYNMNAAIDQGVRSTLKNNQLKESFSLLEKYKKQEAALQRSAAGASAKQQIDSRKEIESLQKRIKLIQEDANARKKAIQERQRSESFITSIQKKQLEYQEALASGDMSRAAQAQLDINQIGGERQSELAQSAIDQGAEKRIAPLQKQIDALNDKNQKMADSASLAGSSLDKFTPKISSLAAALESYTGAVVAIKRQEASGKPVAKEDYAALYQLFKDLQKENPSFALPAGVQTTKTSILTGQQMQLSPSEIGKQIANSLKDVFKSKEYMDSQAKYTQDLVFGQILKPSAGATATMGPDPRKIKLKLPGKAIGGNISGGLTYLVGENGPEFLQTNFSGNIIPNNQIDSPRFNIPSNSYSLRGGMSGSQTSYTINNNISGSDMDSNELADVITRRTLAAIKSIEYNRNAANGRPGARSR